MPREVLKKTKGKRKRSASLSSSADEDRLKSNSSIKKRHRSKKAKHKESRRRSSSSSSTSSSDYKKKKKKHKKKKHKSSSKDVEMRSKAAKSSESKTVGPVLPTTSAVSKGPMTKEMWEKQQSEVRRVFDPDTGRHRLVRGSGEIIEEIVSKEQQKRINKMATQGDGISYSIQTGTLR